MPISMFTPGPTHIPESVLNAMHRAEDHHRTTAFSAVLIETAELLAESLESKNRPIFLACSGSGAMESTIISCVSKTDHLGYLDAGKFGERWGDIAKAYALPNSALKLPWGESPSVAQVKNFLKDNATITHFAMQYCETSTTALHDVPNIIKMINQEFPRIITIVDAISAATTLPISLSDLPIDALVLTSQKAYMLPPGLSMIILSDRYLDAASKVNVPSLYFNLLIEWDNQKKGYTAWTPAISLIFGLNATLKLLAKEGYNQVFKRHQECKELSHFRFKNVGFSTLPIEIASTSVTAGFPIDHTDPEKTRICLQDDFGIMIAGGQDLWKGKMLRVGHMGIISPDDLNRCFDALEKCL